MLYQRVSYLVTVLCLETLGKGIETQPLRESFGPADCTTKKNPAQIQEFKLKIQSLTKQLSHAKTWKFVSVQHQIVQIPPYRRVSHMIPAF